MTTKIFRRQKRKYGPPMPRGEIILESPPDMPEAQPKNLAQYLMVIPMVAGGLSMMLMMSRRGMRGGGGEGNELMMLAGGLMGVSMMGMMITNIAGGKNNKKAEFDAERRDFMRYLSQVRRRARNGAEKQWRSARWTLPDPKALWSLVGTRRMWERRRTDDDVWMSRVGVGKHRLSMKIVPPETKPVEDLEPMSSIALRRFVSAHSSVHDMPRALNITHAAIHMLRGQRDVVAGNVRAQLCHMAVLHSPDDLLIAVVAAPDRISDWHWLKWLPHNQHPSTEDGAGEVRLMFHSAEELEKSLRDQLQGRGAWSPASVPPDEQPMVVVVVDGGDVTSDDPIGAGTLAGVSVFDFKGELPRKAGPRYKLIEYEEDVTATQNHKHRKLGAPDVLSYGEAEGIARSMSKWRMTVGPAPGLGDQLESAELAQSPLAEGTNFADLLGFDPDDMDPKVHWKDKPLYDFLKIPIGPGADGAPIELDFKEAAQNGMGPHGLLIGATGSGKSEVLRTLVGALVATHSSDELNFILVDFKGGATFASLDVMPHTSAVITNLADEVSLVDRMADAIEGELLRRQEVLRAAGNYTNRTEYEKARKNGADLEPLPALMIVADEFSEMLVAKPEFINVFLQIGRIGRSIGVYMLLASQRLEEGKLKGLDTFLSYRVALRTFSASESRTVIGTGDAYELPQAPGHGYLQIPSEGLVRFRASYVGGDYKRTYKRHTSKEERAAAVQHRVQRFLPGHVELPPEPEQEKKPEDDGDEVVKIMGEDGQPLSELEVLVNHVRGQGKPAHAVWLPPFDKPPTIDELLPPLEATPERGLSVPNFPLNNKLTAIVGEEDRPREQKRVPFTVDLSGAGGSLALVGGAQSGKSTMLRSMVSSLCLTHTPREVQFYCLDFGGGTLRGLADLPHVAGVFGRRDEEGIRRTFQEVEMILNEREEYFTNNNIDGIGTFRRGKAEGKFTDDPRGDIFLVIDNWLTVREDFDNFVDTVRTIGNRGLSMGIHVLVTASRWGDIRMNMRDMFGTKLELKLSDNMESEVDRKLQLNVPKNRPGRGLTLNKLHSMAAAPRIDGIRDADDLSPGVEDMVKQVKQAWQAEPAPPLRLLPREMPPQELLQVAENSAKPGIPIGINEAGLKPVHWDPSQDPHLLIFGEAECGKTNLLRHIGRYIQDNYDPKKAKILNIDLRRDMIEQITKPTLLDYVMSTDKMKKAVEGIAPLIESRLPGDDVTPQQLRDKSWWKGPELFVIVDDYETTGSGRTNPLAKFSDFIGQGTDIGFHFIIARRMAGAARSGSDPVLGKIKDAECPVYVMSGRKEEGNIVNKLRPKPQPPGRGTLVTRKDGEQLVQTPMMPSLK
ncbi:type VII secretion protein EccC [Haloglycomyces albus]|uniref:type VII secretion protein EccC n=1 Tax=Haloglycomyces albus TaxID=526067 RepID=UPI00046CA624|nr:type VII secretion protein EccC [Haloglycomyces albus]